MYKDTYTIREIHRQYVTIDGKKYKLTQVYDLGPAQKITVSDSAKNGAVIDFGTYTNTAIPKMTSSAISTDTNTKMSVAGKNSSFKDSVKATNLKASTKYTLMSVAVDANTGKAYEDYIYSDVMFITVTKLYVKNEAYQVIEEILDRRSRKGLSTFILSRASLEDISARDIKGDFKAIKRDGLDDCKYPAIIRYTDQFSRRSM